MTKEEIVKTLKDNWIKPDGHWRTYEKAKKLICEGDLLPSEYDFKIKIITEYLKI